MLYITSDHAGFKLKNEIVTYLTRMGLNVNDMGPQEYDETDDYPDYVIPTMQEIQKNPNALAIVICKNGVGVSVVANKFAGIRCALSWDGKHAGSSRVDDNANVLALPAAYLTREQALDVVHGWLEKDFSGEARHVRRLQKIAELEL